VRVAAPVLALLFLLLVALAALDRWPAGLGYSVGGAPVSRERWLRDAAPILAVSAGWLLGLGAGLARGRPWAGYCVVGLFGSIILVAGAGWLAGRFPTPLAAGALGEAVLFLGIGWWYFFRKPNVVAYLARESDP
jgi:hypothetical protein